MKVYNKFRATNFPTLKLSDNQRIIRDYSSFKIYLDAIGDKELSFYMYAGEFKKHNENIDKDFKMPKREEFGYVLLRLVQERLLEMI